MCGKVPNCFLVSSTSLHYSCQCQPVNGTPMVQVVIRIDCMCVLGEEGRVAQLC